MAEELWLDDASDAKTGRRGRSQRVSVVGAVVACALVVAVPVTFVLTGHSGPNKTADKPDRHSPVHVAKGTPAHQVLAALSATTDSGNFELNYSFGSATAPPPSTTTTTCQPCNGAISEQNTVSGNATVDVQPFALAATANVDLGLSITLRSDGTDVWVGGGAGLAPERDDTASGSPLSGFSSLIENYLGKRFGALVIMGASSPTGYFNLDGAATGSTQPIGSGTIDGVAVQNFKVTMTLADYAAIPGLTPQELTAVTDALGVLSQQGFTGSTVIVSIDSAGYIRQSQSTATFSDGTTIASDAIFSNFGCAGTVLMPGQTGSMEPPAGCVSPDNPGTATVPTTVPGEASTTTTSAGGNPPDTSTTATTMPTATSTTTTSPLSPPLGGSATVPSSLK